MIAVCGIVKNEIDIISLWLHHTFAEGIDHIYLADGCSTDGTREMLDQAAKESGQVTVLTDDDEYVHQADWTNRLAAMAAEEGATWICPTDVDEFLYAPSGATVAETLLDCLHNKLFLTCWPHVDWRTKFEQSQPLPKVAYRWSPDAKVTVGNHDVTLPGGEFGLLEMRELQFRGFDHFVTKVKARDAVVSPADKAIGVGWHCTRLANASLEELQTEWDQMMARPTVYDPIPTHTTSIRSFR